MVKGLIRIHLLSNASGFLISKTIRKGSKQIHNQGALLVQGVRINCSPIVAENIDRFYLIHAAQAPANNYITTINQSLFTICAN